MLILGEKYKFTEFELEQLNKKKYIIDMIAYADKDPQDVLEKIKSIISKEIKTVIRKQKWIMRSSNTLL